MLKKYVTVSIIPIAAILLAVYQQVRAVNTGYELEELRTEMTRMSLYEEHLECEVASMKSPNALLAKAEELGMEFEVPAARIAMEGDNYGVHQP